MFDPLTIGILAFAVLNFTFYKVGRWAEHRTMLKDPEGKTALKERLFQAESRASNLEYHLDNYKRWYEQWKAAAETHVKEKEKLKEIALSHEVKWPDPPKAKFEQTQVWEKRRYSNHPSANLKALASDLKQFKGREVNLVVDLRPCGGWKNIVSKKGYQDERFFKKMAFEGPPERVIEEITAFFKDHDMPFMTQVDRHDREVHEQGAFGETLKWNDTDSAIVMQIDMSVTERIEPAKKPEIHIVQIPIIETKILEIERVVEKVVEVPMVDQERLAALVEVTVQEQLTNRALRKASPVSSERPQLRPQAQKTGG